MWELVVFLFIGWYGVGMAAGLGLLWLRIVRRKSKRPPAAEVSTQHRGERTRSSRVADERAFSPANRNPA